ncbi:Protein of unknown function [Pyronema omphalodes CBS 100304]|uniref:C3H1-type domain-containing protein n=1 Tax=Pyronema omphalodes (strain CBS 100304) TaxID=1076935 RepID=U4LI92_PYROM|nr:Protein of unknown function [Pyronema omphalodes CBS 100304]
MQALNLYMYVMLHFAPADVQVPLALAFFNYTYHLYDLFKRNTFSSVLLYHFNFHNMRLQKDAYDPVGWDAAEISRFHILHPNQRTAQDPFASEHKAKSQATGSKPYGRAMPTCTKYNKGECSHKNCKYPHVCSYCMYPSHTVQQCNKKRQAKGMTSNIRVQGSANGANATSKP